MCNLKFKRVIILSGGIIGDKAFFDNFFSPEDCIICADGGLRNAETLGLSPDLIVGDMDSYNGDLSKFSCKIISFSSEKDKTDTELALEYANQFSPQEIIIVGALGKRVDHALGNIYLLLKGFATKTPVIIIDSYQRIDVVWKDLYINSGNPGDIISLIPLTSEVCGIITSGLKYSLNDENLYLGQTRGISNEIVNIPSSITIKSGLLLVIRNFNL